MDAERTVTDYDNWACDPGNVPGHVAGIRGRLSGLTQEEARSASERRRWPYLVNLETGHLQAHDLCWLCVVSIVHSGPGLPRLRACRRCLGMDRGYAAQLGLRHLLPVFDWPSPPVIDAKRAGALDGWSREVIGRAWSAVEIMDRWRRRQAQAGGPLGGRPTLTSISRTSCGSSSRSPTARGRGDEQAR